jgi:hypothetical protein
MNFELLLKEEKVKPHQVTTLHLIAAFALTGAGALFALYYPSSRVWSIALTIAGIVLLFLTIKRNKWIIQPAVNRQFRIAELLVLGVLALYSFLNNWTPPALMFGVLSGAVLFGMFWEGAKGVMAIRIDESGVKMPAGKAKRDIAWVEIDHVLLKFGTLTINCADNRLYQWSISSTNFDIEAFSAFCDKQIEEGKSKRDENDW